MNEAPQLQQRTFNEKLGPSNQEQMNLNSQKQVKGLNCYKSNILIDKSEPFIEQKHFGTNQTFNYQAQSLQQGKAINLLNQIQNKQQQSEIEQSRKEKESRIQDLMNIAQKAVQRRKERIFEKYLQPNQNIIDDQL
ncbi:unnamed protein product [Paramecium octaurelia]|uniref:Uncharacterized protein n=1 Tax=Paramecium octaurelia TaxID=43137 RepID=A0A8S1TSL9_PAROT|nr:unnamed protein product [Paramecium octaurelia]